MRPQSYQPRSPHRTSSTAIHRAAHSVLVASIEAIAETELPSHSSHKVILSEPLEGVEMTP